MAKIIALEVAMGKWKWDQQKERWVTAGTVKNSRNSINRGAEEKRRQVYEFIRTFIGTYKYSPSVRDITDGCGFSSTSHVAGMLPTLRDRGYITYVDGLSRTIVILKRSWSDDSNSVQ